MKIVTREQIWEALDYIRGDYNVTNVDIARKCVQQAIVLGNKKLEFDARNQYLSQLDFCNFVDEAIVQFMWLLNYKKNNELQPDSIHSILWKFKWIIGSITNYHNIPLGKIYEVLAQLEAEYKSVGNTEKVIEYIKTYTFMSIGKVDLAEEHYKRYKKSTLTGEYDDCLACQLDYTVYFNLAKKDYEKTIEAAKDLVNKKYTCKEVPHITYPKLNFAHMMLGQMDKAAEYCQLALQKIKLSNPQDGIYRLLFYLGKTKGFVQGKKLIDKQLHFFLELKSDTNKYDFYCGCYIFFKYMVTEHINVFKIKLKDNSNFIIPIKKDEYDTAALKQWFYDQAFLHATLLDKRNENNYYQDNLNYYNKVFN